MPASFRFVHRVDGTRFLAINQMSGEITRTRCCWQSVLVGGVVGVQSPCLFHCRGCLYQRTSIQKGPVT